MNIDVSQIIANKLEQMEAEGVIKRKIEEALEKSILSAITSELESYSFRRGIEDQLKEAVGGISQDCGLKAYNGFIAQACKAVVKEHFTTDIAEKVKKALNDCMFQKYENIKLSDIFNRYRDWVWENTDDSDKYDRQHYTGDLVIKKDGLWTKYIVRFADHPLENGAYYKEAPEIEIRFSVYGDREKSSRITILTLDGHSMKDSLKIGQLTDFEAFIVNLYYNNTEVLLDADDVDDSDDFDIDY